MFSEKWETPPVSYLDTRKSVTPSTAPEFTWLSFFPSLRFISLFWGKPSIYRSVNSLWLEQIALPSQSSPLAFLSDHRVGHQNTTHCFSNCHHWNIVCWVSSRKKTPEFLTENFQLSTPASVNTVNISFDTRLIYFLSEISLGESCSHRDGIFWCLSPGESPIPSCVVSSSPFLTTALSVRIGKAPYLSVIHYLKQMSRCPLLLCSFLEPQPLQSSHCEQSHTSAAYVSVCARTRACVHRGRRNPGRNSPKVSPLWQYSHQFVLPLFFQWHNPSFLSQPLPYRRELCPHKTLMLNKTC